MKKKRFIFDLDQTLMSADYSKEKDYFDSVFKSDAEIFTSQIAELLYEYERTYEKYEVERLSDFLKKKTKLDFNEKIVREWIDLVGMTPSKLEEGIISTLDYLKRKDSSIVVLTNWFYDSQSKRIKNSELREFIDDIYAGDTSLKPRREAYNLSRGEFHNTECLFIGDNFSKDYIGPRMNGIESILYDKDSKYDIYENDIVKIKKMGELKERY